MVMVKNAISSILLFFNLYATAKSEIPICSNKHEIGLILALIYFMKRTMSAILVIFHVHDHFHFMDVIIVFHIVCTIISNSNYK